MSERKVVSEKRSFQNKIADIIVKIKIYFNFSIKRLIRHKSTCLNLLATTSAISALLIPV